MSQATKKVQLNTLRQEVGCFQLEDTQSDRPFSSCQFHPLTMLLLNLRSEDDDVFRCCNQEDELERETSVSWR